MRYRFNPDVTQTGLHYLQHQTMWWAAKGPCDLKYVPPFRGLGSSPLPKEEDYAPEDWRDIQKNWDSIARGQEFLRWMEDLFDEVRQEIRPQAPSRIGNAIVCPILGEGFCRQPAAWTANSLRGRSHVYEIKVTGTAITVDSELITNARHYGSETLTRYGGGWSGRPPDLAYWKIDDVRMDRARGLIRSIARDYWRAENEAVQDGSKETIIEGEARIVDLILVAGGDQI